MRSFADGEGASWDALVGKASWGTLVLLFVPRAGGEPRSVIVVEETQFDAEHALEAMTDEALRAQLAASTPGTSG